MMRTLLACVFTLGLASSCAREMAQEPKEPQFTEIAWEVPFADDVLFGDPLQATLVDSDTLLCVYYVERKTEERYSKLCFVTLSTGLCRWLEYPYSAGVKRISSEEITVKPFGDEGREAPWTFVDIPSLKERTDSNIPHGRCFFTPEVYGIVSNENDIWLCDRTTRQEYPLPVSKHGVERHLWIAMAPGRIVLTGWPDDYDTFWLPRTQLWSFPQLQKIAEYQTSQPWSWQVRTQILGDFFVYPLVPGVLGVASLHNGEQRFVLGQPPATQESADEKNGGIIVVDDTSGYVRETRVILTMEQISKNHVTLNAYDTLTGKKVRTVQMQNKTLDSLWRPIYNLNVGITKVGEEWVLLEQVTNPRDDPDKGRCSMRLIPYRIRDFKKADKPIEFVWDCFLGPIVDSGRLIVPGTDHVRICSLADMVDFNEPDGAEPGVEAIGPALRLP